MNAYISHHRDIANDVLTPGVCRKVRHHDSQCAWEMNFLSPI